MTRRLNLSQDVYCYGTLVFLIGITHFIHSEIVFKVIYLFYGPPIVNCEIPPLATRIPIYALKHTYQLRGMASTLRMRTTISPPVVAAMDSCFVLIRTH